MLVERIVHYVEYIIQHIEHIVQHVEYVVQHVTKNINNSHEQFCNGVSLREHITAIDYGYHEGKACKFNSGVNYLDIK